MSSDVILASGGFTYVVGIDPDSIKHGVAIYKNGELSVCTSATTQDLVCKIIPTLQEGGAVLFSVEDVMANKAIYARNTKFKKAVETTLAQQVGRCKQAQYELLQWLHKLEIPYVLHKPRAGNWADNKALFEQRTGWAGRSNSDSRSAAFFGYLALKTLPRAVNP